MGDSWRLRSIPCKLWVGGGPIIGAKLVNHEGEIVQANTEVLRAIRGGGGTLGVIVELTVKAYPLDKVILWHEMLISEYRANVH
jgi:FAD/FMN-containing dehydrogenase